MVKHNNVIPNQHFHKKWQRRVKTWLDQPAQKKIRRNARKLKAAAVAPAPAAGALRPLVHCPTQKYNSKIKLGRGFTLEELKKAGINRKLALTIGISVDHRRTNKSSESLDLNVDRLKDYKARLVVFPRRSGKKNIKKSDTSLSKKDVVSAGKGINEKPLAAPAVTLATLTEEIKSFKAHATLRDARNTARMVGIRLKKSKEEKKEEKPVAGGAADE